MVEVYFYVPAADAENAVSCGLKLSRWAERQVQLEGVTRNCICALLNPRDDREKYRSGRFACLKLALREDNCWIGDGSLYRVGLERPEVMALYERSIVPIREYRFGSYRLPECLVMTTPVAEEINLVGKGLDSPILFDNSEELYLGNLEEVLKEQYEDFYDTVLYSFFSRLVENGKFRRFEDRKGSMAVFEEISSGEVRCIRIPDAGVPSGAGEETGGREPEDKDRERER